MNILYITNSSTYNANTVYDYDRSFLLYSKNTICYLDIANSPLTIDIENFDIIIFSYAFSASTRYFSHVFFKKIANFQGKKLIFFQDEYTNYIKHKNNLKQFDIDAIITVMPESSWNDIYGQDEKIARLPKLQVLTGYIPEHLKLNFDSRLPLSARKWTIGYRTRTLPPIFGKLAHEKYEIGVNMKKICEQTDTPHNIELTENKRIYGKAWPEFIRNCRLMLGAESGCNVFDFTGEIARKISLYQQMHPEADFWEIHKNCLEDVDGLIRTNQISPRIFEGMSLGTGHILYEGEYSGIIKPWRHYIPLKKDYSNIDEVLEAVRDEGFIERMICQSYEDIVASDKYSYRQFIKKIDSFIDSIYPEAANRQKKSLSAEVLIKARPELKRTLSVDEIDILQKAEEVRIKQFREKYRGKKLLAFGAGEAFKKYKDLFASSQVIAIVVDDKFYKGDGHKFEDIPVINMDQARDIAQKIDVGIVFSRSEWAFLMYEKMADLFPVDNPPEICTLYACKS